MATLNVRVIKGNHADWLKHCIGHIIEVDSKIHEPDDKSPNSCYRTTDKGTEQIKKILNEFDDRICAYYIDVKCTSENREEKLKRILNIK